MSQRSTAQHCHIETPFCTIRKSHVTWNFAVPAPHSEEIRRCTLLLLCTLDKNKSVQRLISSLWGTSTAKFQVTWLLRIVQKGVSRWQCCAVDRWLMSGAYRCKTWVHLLRFSFIFSSRKLAERVHKGQKVRLFKDRHTQSTMGASIARKRTRLDRRVLCHLPAQVCASSCIMTCFSCTVMVFRYSKRARTFCT